MNRLYSMVYGSCSSSYWYHDGVPCLFYRHLLDYCVFDRVCVLYDYSWCCGFVCKVRDLIDFLRISRDYGRLNYVNSVILPCLSRITNSVNYSMFRCLTCRVFLLHYCVRLFSAVPGVGRASDHEVNAFRFFYLVMDRTCRLSSINGDLQFFLFNHTTCFVAVCSNM